MANRMVRHGSNSGYKAELEAGNKACERCRRAHTVYQKQYTRAGKAAGLKYHSTDVIDNQWSADTSNRAARLTSPARHDASVTATTGPVGPADSTTPDTTPPVPGRAWTDRLRGLVAPGAYPETDQQPYVEDPEIPEWLHQIEPDPEPSGEWSNVSDPVDDNDYVITAEAIQKIETNLGTYLSVVGMTVEMIDPYCGPVLASNFDEIVKKWAKLVSHYPSAAKLFLDEKGGVLFAWIAAIQATWPVLYAIYEHHLSKSVKVDNGTVYRIQKTPDGSKRFDPTMPPMPDQYEYSAT